MENLKQNCKFIHGITTYNKKFSCAKGAKNQIFFRKTNISKKISNFLTPPPLDAYVILERTLRITQFVVVLKRNELSVSVF